MAVRVAIALALATFAWTGSAPAENDPACAKYNDAMSYNLCLASHGPKANDIGKLRGGAQPGRAAHDRPYNHGTRPGARGARFTRWRGPQRAHGRMHMEFQVR